MQAKRRTAPTIAGATTLEGAHESIAFYYQDSSFCGPGARVLINCECGAWRPVR